jgi:hypothetical protein
LRIDRKAVVADVASVAALIVRPFAFVAIGAERLQRSEPKGVPIATMRRIVVSDGRRSHAPLVEARGAKRLDPELMMRATSPTLKTVPFTPRQRLRGIGVQGWHEKKRSARRGQVASPAYLGATKGLLALIPRLRKVGKINRSGRFGARPSVGDRATRSIPLHVRAWSFRRKWRSKRQREPWSLWGFCAEVASAVQADG